MQQLRGKVAVVTGAGSGIGRGIAARCAREGMKVAVHLLVNNAGFGAGTTVWESTLADWEWTLGVDLWGVIYGIKV